MTPPSLALVLAGGRSTRLGGAEKASVEVGGIRLVDRVYSALRGSTIVAVGPDSIARPGLTVVREDPPFGGPVAAIAAGLAAFGTVGDGAETWLLACDLAQPRRVVELLSHSALGSADALVIRDARGRPQWFAGRYRVVPLRRVIAGLPDRSGVPMRTVAAHFAITWVDGADSAADLDTWDEIAAHRARPAADG